MNHQALSSFIFYVFTPPRSLHEIGEELKALAVNITGMLEGLAE